MSNPATASTPEMRTELPLAQFPGRITLVDSIAKLDEELERICALPVIGLDTESRPSFRKGEYHPVSLLQLASEDSAWLIRINHTGFTTSLRQLLSDPHVVKVGLSLKDDIHRLQQLGAFKAASMVEIQHLAKRLGLEEQSLRGITERMLGLRVSKACRLTNWESEHLTPAQQLYAATDAWLCLRLYQHKAFQALLADFQPSGFRP